MPIAYFTEIEMLQNKIKQLEEQLNEEREEYKAIYAMMKKNLADFIKEIEQLKKENQVLTMALVQHSKNE